MITRIIQNPIKQTNKSILLLGPRQVGKSTLIKYLQPELSINFANEMEFLTHTSRPGELERLIELNAPRTIFLDEIQRVPQILNTVQTIIDGNKKLKFYLTGSSARKLKRGNANLLPGRVLNFNLGPLVSAELDYKLNTLTALSLGTLPEIYLEENKTQALRLLKSYVANYLREEIKAEALTRSLESFSRFLLETSLVDGQFVDYTKLAHRSKISRHSIPRYFEILEDTLIGRRIWPYSDILESEDLIKHPKFYFFDTGVANSLVGNFTPSRDRIGKLAEQLVCNQILHSSWAFDKDTKLFSFRNRAGVEVDFILQIDSKTVAIEVKNSDELDTSDCEGLEYFSKVNKTKASLFIFHMGVREKKFGKIWSLPWQKGLKNMGL